MVSNQRQLSIVVSDWESYLGSLFSPPVFVGNYLFSVSVCVRLGSFMTGSLKTVNVTVSLECLVMYVGIPVVRRNLGHGCDTVSPTSV